MGEEQSGLQFNTIAIAIVIALAVLIVLYYVSHSVGVQSSGAPTLYQGTVAVKLTDPPQVPRGTSALAIYYSSVSAHTSGAGGAGNGGWLSQNTSGKVDLMALVNVTQVIGLVPVPKGSTVNIVRFNVSKATITINGTTYNVTVPNGQVQANLQQSTTVNGSSTVLVDLVPTIVAIYTNSSTIFVLSPSVKAVVVGGGASANVSVSVGQTARITTNESATLRRSRANVTISAVSLARSSGNVTTFSMTLKNNANTSVNIKELGFKGNYSVKVNQSGISANLNATINQTLSQIKKVFGNKTISVGANGQINTSVINQVAQNQQLYNMLLQLSQRFNISVTAILTTSGSVNYTKLSILLHQKAQLTLQTEAGGFAQQQRQNSPVIVFRISATGSIFPESTQQDYQSETNFTIQSGQSQTFTYIGQISMANGRVVVSPIPGQTYITGAAGPQTGLITMSVVATGT